MDTFKKNWKVTAYKKAEEPEHILDAAEQAARKVPAGIDWTDQVIKIALIMVAQTGIALATALYYASKYMKEDKVR